MKFRHVLLFFVLFLVPFMGCKKENPFSPDANTPKGNTYLGVETSGFSSEGYCYDPKPLNAEIISVRQMLANEELGRPGFGAVLEEAFGTVLWDAYEEEEVYEDNVYLGKIVGVPIVIPDRDSLSATLIIYKGTGDEITVYFFKRELVLKVLNSPVASETALNLAAEAYYTFSLDDKVFCSFDESSMGNNLGPREWPPCWWPFNNVNCPSASGGRSGRGQHIAITIGGGSGGSSTSVGGFGGWVIFSSGTGNGNTGGGTFLQGLILHTPFKCKPITNATAFLASNNPSRSVAIYYLSFAQWLGTCGI